MRLKRKFILLSVFLVLGTLVQFSQVFIQSVLAVGAGPISYDFDNDSNPQSMDITAPAIGGFTTNLPGGSCGDGENFTQQYQIGAAWYSISDLGINNAYASFNVVTPEGQDTCHPPEPLIPWTYTVWVNNINVSGLSAGSHQACVKVHTIGGSPLNFEYCSNFTINRPAPTGTACVKSNKTTSWTLWGDSGMSGSGTSATYTDLPLRDYTLYPADLAGYTRTTTPSAQQSLTYNGQEICFAIKYTAIPTVGDIRVKSNVKTGWSISGQENFRGNGGPSDYVHYNKKTGNYYIVGDAIAGKTLTYPLGSGPKKLKSDGEITFELKYTTNYIPCSGSATRSCTSSANSCGTTANGTQSRTCNTATGTWSGWSSCSASPPPTPAPVACTGAKSASNSCGDYNLGGPGTITCSGTSVESACSGATGSKPAERSNYGNACYAVPSGANACGQIDYGTNGTYVCNGGANSGLGTRCTAVNGVTPPNSSCPAPVATISANPNPVGYGGASTISWSCTNSSSGSVSGIGSGLSGSGSTGALTSNQTYTVTCAGFNGSNVSNSVTVTVSAPTVSITANGVNGPIIVPWNSNVTIAWSSTNAGSCTITPPGWTGTSGSQPTGNFTIPGTYVYTITCSGNGSASANQFITISAPIPSAYSVTYSHPDYCSSGPGGYVAWSYSDPAGSPQASYEIQIDDQGSFQNPVYDSGQLNSSSKILAVPNGILQFGVSYKARVRVWNSYGGVSPWSSPTNTWNTPPYAYPNVIPPYQFTWPTPPKPQQNKLLQFTDHTVFGGGNVNNRSWIWTFGDGGTSTQQSPAHTYTTIGNYTVSETVTDAANQTCSYSQSLNVQKPIPVIKEVAPK